MCNIYPYRTKCKYPALLAEAIYTNSAHQPVIGIDNIKKRRLSNNSSSHIGSKACNNWHDDPSSNPPFAFLLPFHISYHIGKAFIFSKNEGNNWKVKIKVNKILIKFFLLN